MAVYNAGPDLRGGYGIEIIWNLVVFSECFFFCGFIFIFVQVNIK